MLKTRQLLIQLMLLQNISGEYVFKNEVIKKMSRGECLYASETFWKVYGGLHFNRSKTVTILILYTQENHRRRLKIFTDSILKHVSESHLYANIKIREKFMAKYTKSENRRKYEINELPRENYHNDDDKIINMREFLEIKGMIADVDDGYVLVLWNEETLQKFLDQDYKSVIPKSRASYAIFFLYPKFDPNDCDTVHNDISQILVRFWSQYQVLDVISQRPCACRNIYTYRPFYKINSTLWGLAQSNPLDKISTNYNLILNWAKNFNGHPMKISLFIRQPTSLTLFPKPLRFNPIYESFDLTGGFGGQDGNIIGEIAKYYNFKVEIVPVSDGNDFGKVMRNGTITGSLGDVISNRVYFSGNGRFLMDYGTNQIEFTMPYSSDQICPITPKALPVPQWRVIFDCFDPPTWLLMAVSVILSTLLWAVLRGKPFARICWEMFSLNFGFPIKLKLNASVTQIVFISSCLFSNLIIFGIFQGALFRAFTTVTYDADIDTLEDLDDSGLPISSSLDRVLDEDGSQVIRNLRRKLIHINDDLNLVATRRNFVALDRRNDVELFLKTRFLSETGAPLLHISGECFTSYFIAYIMAEGSPLITIFNHIIIRLVESGLTDKWYNDVVYASTLEHLLGLPQEKIQKPFSIGDIQVAFYLLTIGYLCATLVFFWESVRDYGYQKGKLLCKRIK